MSNERPDIGLYIQYRIALSIASTAILELLQSAVSTEKVTALSQTLSNNGKTSVPVSLLLIVNMLGDLETISPDLELILKKVLAHHSFEVISDNLPPQLANIFNTLAIRICEQPDTFDCIGNDPNFTKLEYALSETYVELGHRMLVIDALRLNLKAIAELISMCESKDPYIFQYIKKALTSRYSAVSEINNGLYQNPQTDFTKALNARADSILIKVTQMCFIAGMCAGNKELTSYLLTNFEVIAQAVDNAALLIGMWNDCGSQTLISGNVNYIREHLEANTGEQFREVIHQRLDSVADDTQELMRQALASDLQVERREIEPLRQLLKDAARGEPNLLLDFGDSIDDTFKLLKSTNSRLVEDVESFFVNQDVPISIRTIVAGAVYQHMVLYGGLGDYYDQRDENFLLELYRSIQHRINFAINHSNNQ